MQHWKQAGSGLLDAGRYVMAGGRHRRAGRRIQSSPKGPAVPEGLRKLAAEDHELLGHAAPQHAGATRAAGLVRGNACKRQLADGRLSTCTSVCMTDFRLQAPNMQCSMHPESWTVINGGGLSAVPDRSLTPKSASLARRRFQRRL